MSCSKCRMNTYLWKNLFMILEHVECSTDDEDMKELAQQRFEAVESCLKMTYSEVISQEVSS